MPRNYDSRAKHPGVESYFFFAALSGGWCVERRRMGGIRRAFLRTRSSSMSRVEDQGGGTGWIREEMICGGVAARVTDSSFRFPPDLSPLPRKRFACLKMDARMELGQGDTRRNYLMRHGDASSRASVTITKALHLLCLSPRFGGSHLLAEKSVYIYI